MTPKIPNPLYILTNFINLQTNLPNYKASHQSLDHAFPPSREVGIPHLHPLTAAAGDIDKRQEVGVGGGECVALAAQWTLRHFQIITIPSTVAAPRHHPHQKPPQQEEEESISFTFEDSLDRSTTCSGMQVVGSPFALFAPCEDEAVKFHWDGTGTGGQVLVRESVACSP